LYFPDREIEFPCWDLYFPDKEIEFPIRILHFLIGAGFCIS